MKKSKTIISKGQQQILNLLTKDFLTVKQIALRRNTTRSAVYKSITKLKKTGHILIRNKGYFRGLNISDGVRARGGDNQIRLHGQEFNIKILFKDERYDFIKAKSNVRFINGSTIRLYVNSLEVYTHQSFYADDPDKAFFKSIDYLHKILNLAEDQFKIVLIKNNSSNIRLVNEHYAHTNDEIAKDCLARSKKLKIYAQDGRLRCLVDNSHNLKEFETVNGQTSKNDMRSYKDFIVDVLDNPDNSLSKTTNLAIKNTSNINALTNVMSVYEKNISSHVQAIKDMSKAMQELRDIIRTKGV